MDVDSSDDRLGGRSGAVVVGGVGDLHTGEGADHRLVLEDGLQSALADLRLVGSVGSVELPPAQDRVHHGGGEVAVGTRPQEAGAVAGGEVGPGQRLQFPTDLHLRESAGQIQFGEAGVRGHVLEQFFNGPDADGSEHGIPFLTRMRNVWHNTSVPMLIDVRASLTNAL